MSFLTQFNVAVAPVKQAKISSKRTSPGEVLPAIAQVSESLAWSDKHGPFGNLVRSKRVLIKPNLVLHRNEGTGGLQCLVTDAGLIQAVVRDVLEAGASEVVVGD